MKQFFKSFLPHPILSLVLWGVWLLLNNTLAPGHIVLGAILALLIPKLTASFWPEKVCLSHPVTILKFTAIVLWDIMVANIIVAKLILGRTQHLQPAFLTIELDIQHPLGISLLANTISLTPGTVSCDLSEDRRCLLVHGLHVEDADETINEIKQRYERPLMEIFESC
ncbi:Na+/H+ antiporter subunit E [Thiomicrorhabdus sp. zzn3]|uniref:Na+/H+ antiporter subunit E n=1 Tax=Thiomicrorhabdus sp. zzn3 TaxID=3039775 RepID=UPI002436A75C|nr:Na+/H+ antiporter subunit E [Thiomicrorhabdus sp. zzn3]MDG6778769.1 Na+/H+ antiporter subunit E [Thiomicrorhabdus sp. zzn3]